MGSLIVLIAVGYIAAGLLFGVFFAVSGAARLDPVAKGAPLTFRVLTIPAATALWPLLLIKLLGQRRTEE